MYWNEQQLMSRICLKIFGRFYCFVILSFSSSHVLGRDNALMSIDTKGGKNFNLDEFYKDDYHIW